MKIILLTLALLGICEHAQAEEERDQFCYAWAMDAMQGSQKMLAGVTFDQIESLINNLPEDVLPQHAKERAVSAVRWAYYFQFDMQTAFEIGGRRCMTCIDQKNPVPCLRRYDESLEKAIIAGEPLRNEAKAEDFF